MIYWIRRMARLIALGGFFIIFISGINLDNAFDTYTATIALLKALCGGILLWFCGFVISDIVLKGAVEDIPQDSLEVYEGGLAQRIHESQKQKRVNDNQESEREKIIKAEPASDKKKNIKK